MDIEPFFYQEPVILNVYNMMAINDLTKLFGIGVFHTGVEIYGSEYAYGGHLSSFTGIYDMNPKDALLLGDDFRYKCSFVIGHTPLTQDEVQLVISHLGKEYRGNCYSMIKKNCNHFTRDFCLMLCGRGIPRWVNRLAGIIKSIPYLSDYAEKNMGPPHVMTQCCGSGVINIGGGGGGESLSNTFQASTSHSASLQQSDEANEPSSSTSSSSKVLKSWSSSRSPLTIKSSHSSSSVKVSSGSVSCYSQRSHRGESRLIRV